jgi:hypothetical protein
VDSLSEWETKARAKLEELGEFTVCGVAYRLGLATDNNMWTFFAVNDYQQRVRGVVHVHRDALDELSDLGLAWLVARASEYAENQIRAGEIDWDLRDVRWSREDDDCS